MLQHATRDPYSPSKYSWHYGIVCPLDGVCPGCVPFRKSSCPVLFQGDTLYSGVIMILIVSLGDKGCSIVQNHTRENIFLSIFKRKEAGICRKDTV